MTPSGAPSCWPTGRVRREQGWVVPGNLTAELLETRPILIPQRGDPLARLAFEIREQTGHVFGGVPPLLGSPQGCHEGRDGHVQPQQEILHKLGRHLRLSQHLLQPRVESPFHGIFPP
jgi:hypothetical protein